MFLAIAQPLEKPSPTAGGRSVAFPWRKPAEPVPRNGSEPSQEDCKVMWHSRPRLCWLPFHTQPRAAVPHFTHGFTDFAVLLARSPFLPLLAGLGQLPLQFRHVTLELVDAAFEPLDARCLAER